MASYLMANTFLVCDLGTKRQAAENFCIFQTRESPANKVSFSVTEVYLRGVPNVEPSVHGGAVHPGS